MRQLHTSLNWRRLAKQVKAARRFKNTRRARKRARRMLKKQLPRHPWPLPPEHEYACFLSHYKVEAGMEARYLKDTLEKILHEQCFLDSQDLSDLHLLITNGLMRIACSCCHRTNS